eukprot:CAMPEP_0196807868 /NCGR_PEP_ID=MMETSP1362-20130617/7852_1 /TAXON_ID=163516 /ORGANISM="Leptocylindrus danicus, Strain CCMP1856" /LENGTH=522 /DNA_ID=CAMNT_0042181961 /DNA_START=363 /DNA_END=1931 /DNA_ORIENTATION=+
MVVQLKTTNDTPLTTDNKQQSSSNNSTITLIISALYISAFAICGTLFRVLIGTLFGSYCEDPTQNAIKHLFDYSNKSSFNGICLTSAQSALFVDLPANMVGSLLMGMLQSGLVLGLANSNNVPIAWLPIGHRFQGMDAIHLAFRTGFCGSITTFSSWNTQMVTLLTSGTQGSAAQAIFGYIIGLELALASYTIGKHIAILGHRYLNPLHAREADIMVNNNSSTMTPEHAHHFVYHRDLPDFERHYLTNVFYKEEVEQLKEDIPMLMEELEKWKKSTQDHRNLSCNVRGDLSNIERCLLVEEDEPNDLMLNVAQQAGWDVDALRRYAHGKNSSKECNDSSISLDDKSCRSDFSSSSPIADADHAVFAAIVLLVTCGLLISSALLTEGHKYTSQNYQTFCISGLFAVPGALMRWRLSKLNGKLQGKYQWLPVGTFIANVTASLISISVTVVLDQFSNDLPYWGVISLVAVKTGLAGSLSTVSSFVAEIDQLLKSFPMHIWGYIYATGTIFLACILCVTIYAPVI